LIIGVAQRLLGLRIAGESRSGKRKQKQDNRGMCFYGSIEPGIERGVNVFPSLTAAGVYVFRTEFELLLTDNSVPAGIAA
jgi:hypothetical protein